MTLRHPLWKFGALTGLIGVLWLLLDGSAQAPATIAAARVRPVLEHRAGENPTMAALAAIAGHRAVPPHEHFSAAIERPLFAPTRRPSPRLAPASTEPASASQPSPSEARGERFAVRLVGTVIRRGTAHALLSKGEGGLQWVERGAIVEGWKVVDVASDRLVLERDGESRELYILR
ncbi:MAG: pilus assembly protein PilP [Geminicoccaceae bacterium]|nr:pilus assembly protein PilP [Geminicoccaceae bacterium]MCS7266845.1 pilus assembly protein PilP [Geminicoccaceae bacterium]MCX7628891.1 pilus assembly protein PilP [Geminicoccaceae bacterium]MDW8340545.1 hypothetical protein [Geminicoccaceae bacterium]